MGRTRSVTSWRPGYAVWLSKFCLRLTEGRQGGNHPLATVNPMATNDLNLRYDLSVRPGESDPAGMLCRVLVLLAAVVPMVALTLTWWLALSLIHI